MRDNWFWFVLLLLQYLVVQFFKTHSLWVEQFYSNYFYSNTSAALRSVLGWTSLSIGDVLYLVVGLVLLLQLIVIWRDQTETFFGKLKGCFFLALRSCCLFLLFFNLLWGYNNYRPALAIQLNIDQKHYNDEQLLQMTQELLSRVEYLQWQLTGDTAQWVQIDYSAEKIFEDANLGYRELSKIYPWIAHDNFSLKKSILSTPLTYMGFSGYINPFTNEAQVNSLVPKIGMFVTSSHEIAHQLGYASESEANFLGYLSATKQRDLKYQYAGYLYALKYCLSTLEKNIPEWHAALEPQINSGIYHNIAESKEFWESYRNPANSFFNSFYGNFLKLNNQKDGLKSYNRFVDLLINYHKKQPL